MGERVNLNTAESDQLTTLPGVGPAMAERIIAGRPFETLDDLLQVSGVGPALLSRLEPLVTLVDPAPEEETIILEAETGEQTEAEEAVIEAESPPEMADELPSEEVIPPWDGEEADEDELIEVEEPLFEEVAIVPVEAREAKQSQPAPKKKSVTWAQAMFMSAAFSFGAFVLAVLLTLGILSSMNDGLRFASASHARALNGEIENLNTQLDIMTDDLGQVQNRLNNLDNVVDRIETLETDVDQLSTEMASTMELVDGLNAQIEEVNLQIEEILTSTDRFQTFLDGLTELLTNPSQP